MHAAAWMCHKDAAQMLPVLAKAVKTVVSPLNSLISCARCQCCCCLWAVICAYLNSQLATSHSASQPSRQPGSFPFVHHCLNPPHLGWSILGTAGAQNSDSQKRKKVSLYPISLHYLQVHTLIYLYALHPFRDWGWTKISKAFFHTSKECLMIQKVVSSFLYVPMSAVALATSWTQMEMD